MFVLLACFNSKLRVITASVLLTKITAASVSSNNLTNYQHDEDPYNSTQPIPKSK